MTSISSVFRSALTLLCLAACFQAQARPKTCAPANVRVSSDASGLPGQWMTFEMGEYALRDQRIKGRLFSRLHCEMSPTQESDSKTDLPIFAAELPVAPGKNVHIIIEDRLCEEVHLDYPLLVSEQKAATNALVETGELLSSDEGNVQKVYFHPVQYDARKKTLRITKSMTLRVEEVQAPSAMSLKQPSKLARKSALPS